MKPIRPYRTRSSSSYLFGSLLLLVVLGGIGGGIFLWGPQLGLFAAAEDPFVVKIPINGVPIPAYSRVTREHLLDPRNQTLLVQKIPPRATLGMSLVGTSRDGTVVNSRVANVERDGNRVVFITPEGAQVPHESVSSLGGALLNINGIIGRVLQKDKRAGLGFREENFFPQGTPEGLAGATPPGMRALTLDATKLIGVHGLQAGDQIDVLASVPVGSASNSSPGTSNGSAIAGLVGSAPGPTTEANTEPALLAEGAVVLKPVYVRNEATSSSSLTQGTRVQNVPKYEVAIAVAANDVVSVQRALDRDLRLTCVARSMRPESTDSASADATPSEDVVMVPVTVRPILAYQVVTREAFIDPATRRVRMEAIPRGDAAGSEVITGLESALGSITRHDIPAGRYLRRSDLLSEPLRGRPATSSSSTDPSAQYRSDSQLEALDSPWSWVNTTTPVQDPVADTATAVGDRPAITQFIPSGYTAFAVPWNRLYGAEHLQIGDRLDLLASFSLERDSSTEEAETRPDGTTIIRKRDDSGSRETLRSWDESFGFRAEPWFVASDAIVVGPVGFPAPAAALRALGDAPQRDGNARQLNGPAIIIAIDDLDVETLATALASQEVLFTPAFHPSGDAAETPEGMKRIVIAAQNVAAYETMSATMWQGHRRRPTTRVVNQDDPQYLKAITVDSLPQWEGRILARAKRRGEAFFENDFLAEGSPGGLAAAAEQGTTIVALAGDAISGLDAFAEGDQVAVLYRGQRGLPEGVIVHGLAPNRSDAEVIVSSATLIQTSRGGRLALRVANRDLTRFLASLDDATGPETTKGSLVAVAIPELRQTHDSVETAQSESAGSEIAPHRGSSDVVLIETMVGSRREVHAFPASKNKQAGAGESEGSSPQEQSP